MAPTTANGPASGLAGPPAPPRPLRVGLLGAECTGKSTLARDLTEALAPDFEVAVAAEALREFVRDNCRAPRQGEQGAIMAAQVANESVAAATLRGERAESLPGNASPDGATAVGQAKVTSPLTSARPSRSIVICDPCALMTAVYSMAYFADSGLLAAGLVHQRAYDLVLWCGPDIPWTPDPGQRDGPDRRTQVAELLAKVVNDEQLPTLSVTGDRAARVKQAMAEVELLPR